MSSDIPAGLMDLNTAMSRPSTEVNVMGVVTDLLPPRRSNGTDWMCTFSIKDLQYFGTYPDGLKVRFFRPMESEMPAIRGTGDVVFLKNLRISIWSGMTIGISSLRTSWVVFPAASIPAEAPMSPLQLKHVKEPRASAPTFPEMMYAINLCNSQDRSTFTEPLPTPAASPVAPSPIGNSPTIRPWKDKFALIKDLEVMTYRDLVGQVVKIYPHNDRLELYLTDYTSNNLLWNYEWGQNDGDDYGREGDTYGYLPSTSSNKKWPGPFGKMTMTVTLWPPHSYYGRQNLKENDFVYLRNVHIKWSKDAKIEGVLHSDSRYPDKVDVTILKNNNDDDRVKDVLRRKRDYTNKFQTSSAQFVAEARGLKRKDLGETKPLSKTAQKKKRKLAREQQLAKQERQDMEQDEDKENQENTKPKEKVSNEIPPLKSQRLDLNKNVKCSNHLIAPRSISAILSLDKHSNTTPAGTPYTLPFQNIKSRATVRIVDFFPLDLADFAVPCPKVSEYDILSDAEGSKDGSDSGSQSADTISEIEEDRPWEWRFGLVLKDAMGPKTSEKATMKVYVAGQDAECLLKLDATNLRGSANALAELREKLFLLWGDLEERKARGSTILQEVDTNSKMPKKDDQPNSKAFQCCLKEYGVKVKVQQSVEREEADGASEDEDRQRTSEWTWERRWRVFGTTII